MMASDPKTTAASQIRESLIRAASSDWRKRLIDTSRRNNLLFYRSLPISTLELPVSPKLLKLASSSTAIKIGELLAVDQTTFSKIRAIARKGLENFEEKGLSTLYLALGKCSWLADDGGRDPFAPIILFPISITLKGEDVRSTKIEVSGKPEVNPVLAYVLNELLGEEMDTTSLLTALGAPFSDCDANGNGSGEDSSETVADLQAALDFVSEYGAKIPGFKAEPFAVIGNFSFQKLAIIKDLEANETGLLANDVVAAISGDAAARRSLIRAEISVDPRGLDSVAPADEFAVLDADSSQQCAIAGIAAGQCAVIHGPPGTGKSQTIANLIATLSAKGKRILFVAEKRAALDVVMSRLVSVGLDHLAIDLHGADGTPKKVMERIANTLDLVRESTRAAPDEIHADYVDRRDRLNRHEQRMHERRAPTGMSIYEMQASLLRLPAEVASPIRWREPDLSSITTERAREIRVLLKEAGDFESLFNRTDPSPWCGVDLSNAEAAQRARDLFLRLAHEQLPRLLGTLSQVTQQAGFRATLDIGQIQEVLGELRKSNELLSIYEQDAFPEAGLLRDSLAPGCTSGLRGLFVRLANRRARLSYRRALSLRKAGSAPWKAVWNELEEAARSFAFWREWSSSQVLPAPVEEMESCERSYEEVSASLDVAEKILNFPLRSVPLSELVAQVQKLAGDPEVPYQVSRTCEVERKLIWLGVQKLIDDIRASRRPASEWIPLFDYVWLSSTMDLVALKDPGVKTFVGATHNVHVKEFGAMDLKRLDLARAQVRRAHAERAVAAMNEFPEQESFIRSEASKRRGRKPLRQVFSEAHRVLTSICPCWMASPLSVCQLISPIGIFDYVIFDEASQILPEDAVASILRGKYIVVAGDNKQLPPMTFFASSNDDQDPEAEAIGYESLLDMMIPFVKGFHLNWHYRSRDEVLIAFSNHHMYDDRLVTFPSSGATPAISHVCVDHVPISDGQEESAGKEVGEVVRLVLEHATNTPKLSLGVITMGIKHANRIQALLDRELVSKPDLAEFFDTGQEERFFIKNLERVQGDERDVIILSVGYGKNRVGDLPLRFGPILGENGRRRLNVAVTRARMRVIVVSSFSYADIDSSRLRPGTGLEFLKNYLQYANSGGRLFANGRLTSEPMNEFEMDVQAALESRGIVLVPQVGSSNFRIDFAACHPIEPGRYVLAIECDGASYHSSYTARDRDRLRQQQLERLGWRFHRIWSTDWFLRRDEEVERAVKSFWKAVEESDRAEAGDAARILFRPSHETTTAGPPASAVENVARSAARPPIPRYASIEDYSGGELQQLLRWVKSDGKLRTNDELVEEMFANLPFKRRGFRINEAIRDAIAEDEQR